MRKRIDVALIASLLVVVMGGCNSVNYVGDKGINFQGNTAKAQVLRRSAQWNAALASRNLPMLFELFSLDAQLATAGGKWAGKDEGMLKFSTLLKKRPDLQWVNRPKEVVVNEGFEVALETGDWTEWWSEPDGMVTIRGTYFLMWKKARGDPWLIHAAIFTPLSCLGQSQYCRPHDQ